eukprot:Opistho-1_new@65200
MEVLSAGREGLWSSLVSSWPYDERWLFVVGTLAVHNGVFWFLNGLLYIVDHFGLFKSYKIRPKDYPPKPLIMDCLKTIFISHFVVQWFALYFAWPVFQGRGMTSKGPLPALPTVVRDVVIMFLVNDTLFYWAHRALHHRSIYKYIHKQHHKFNTSIGIAAEYAHPIESMLANTIPTVGGAALLGTHMSTFWIYLAIRIHETVDAHSGYNFPWSPWHYLVFSGADRHDFHHSHNKGNYGGAPTVFWDWICGTDSEYKKWKAAGGQDAPQKTD